MKAILKTLPLLRRRISMTERPGFGRVHDGFYTALFHGDEEQGVLLSDLLSAIRAADE